MTYELVKEIVDTRPFVPFVLTTSTGTAFRVSHPEHAFMPPTEREILVYDDDLHFRFVTLEHVVSIEPVRDQATKK